MYKFRPVPLRAAAATLVFAWLAASADPALAQSGVSPILTREAQEAVSRSIYTLPPAPQSGGGGAGSGLADRVTTRERKVPERETRTLINLGTKHVHAIFGGLGQGSGTAGGIEVTTADSIRGVELHASALGSLKKYRQFEVGAIFNPRIEQGTQGDIRFRYRRRVADNFFGIEPFSDESFETNYDLEQRQFTGVLSHKFNPDFEIGAYVDVTSSSVYTGDDDEDPAIGDVFSVIPVLNVVPPTFPFAPIQPIVPGLFGGSEILSYGAFLEYDGTNKDKGLTQGFFFYGRVASYDGLDDDAGLGLFESALNRVDFNDFGWVGATLDARAYIPLFSDKTSLALRYYSDLNEPKGGSLIPFYNLARIGGRRTLRGFDTFRFHGENSAVFQGEFRQTFYTGDEPERGADFFVFGDAGQVWGSDLQAFPSNFALFFPNGQQLFQPRTAEEFDSDNFEADLGFGAQYRHNKGFAVRVEYARSNEGSKVWLSFGRGF